MLRNLISLSGIAFAALALVTAALAATPETKNGVTKIHLDQYNGFRYRCPINPTPWYEVGVGS